MYFLVVVDLSCGASWYWLVAMWLGHIASEMLWWLILYPVQYWVKWWHAMCARLVSGSNFTEAKEGLLIVALPVLLIQILVWFLDYWTSVYMKCLKSYIFTHINFRYWAPCGLITPAIKFCKNLWKSCKGFWSFRTFGLQLLPYLSIISNFIHENHFTSGVNPPLWIFSCGYVSIHQAVTKSVL